MFIAEQQLIAVAVGLAVRGYVPFASTVAAFFCRGHDFLRMGAISAANIKLCGSRGAWPVIYARQAFPVGGSRVLRASDSDQVTLTGAGVTVHQCLQGAGDLASEGIAAAVIDLYRVKPADQPTLADAATATGGRLVIAEGHYPQGGLDAAVLETLAGKGLRLQARQCAVGGLPGSGTPGELMSAAGISAPCIAAAGRALMTG